MLKLESSIFFSFQFKQDKPAMTSDSEDVFMGGVIFNENGL